MSNHKIWNYWADKYDRLWVQKYSLGPTRKNILSVIRDYVKDKGACRILDMGCGTGQMLIEIESCFKEYSHELLGADISENMIEAARKKNSNIEFIVSSIEDFKVTDEKFDIIICSHSFPYYKDKEKAIEKFSNLLNPGGLLLLAQASDNNLYDKFVMFFVKFTTSKAKYPCVNEILAIASKYFTSLGTLRIQERFYMPSIYLFMFQKLA